MKICISENSGEIGSDYFLKNSKREVTRVLKENSFNVDSKAGAVLHFCDPLTYRASVNRKNIVWLGGISITEFKALYPYISDADGYVVSSPEIKSFIENRNAFAEVCLVKILNNYEVKSDQAERHGKFTFLWAGNDKDISLERIIGAWQHFSCNIDVILDVKIFNNSNAKKIGNVRFEGIPAEAGINPLAESYEKADAIIVSDSLLNNINETDFAAQFGKPLIYPRKTVSGISRILNPVCATSYSVSSTGNPGYDESFAVNSLCFALKRVLGNYQLAAKKARKAAAEIANRYNRLQEEEKLCMFLKRFTAGAKTKNVAQEKERLFSNLNISA